MRARAAPRLHGKFFAQSAGGMNGGEREGKEEKRGREKRERERGRRNSFHSALAFVQQLSSMLSTMKTSNNNAFIFDPTQVELFIFNISWSAILLLLPQK